MVEKIVNKVKEIEEDEKIISLTSCSFLNLLLEYFHSLVLFQR